jgi:hypothetical protein
MRETKMSPTIKSARRKFSLALLSLAVVGAAAMYVWLPQGQGLVITVSQRAIIASQRPVTVARVVAPSRRAVSAARVVPPSGKAVTANRLVTPSRRAVTVDRIATRNRRGIEAPGVVARAARREQAGVQQRGAEIVYGKVSGPKGSPTRGVVVLTFPGHGSVKFGIGSHGVFRKVLHRPGGRCSILIRADFAGHWYSARGVLKLKRGLAYYIHAALEGTGFFVGFPVTTY